MNENNGFSHEDVTYDGIYAPRSDAPATRHGDFGQRDWEMLFVSSRTAQLKPHRAYEGEYEVEKLEWNSGTFTLVVRVYESTRTALMGWRENLADVRRGFAPDDANMVAGAWYAGEFVPRGLPAQLSPDPAGIHWIR